MTGAATQSLAEFAATLRFDSIPLKIVRKAEDLLLDWFGSALGGQGNPAVAAIDAYAREMGPLRGRSELVGHRRMSSPHFAALVNGACSHVAEQDDIHNGSVLHPGAVVFPPALALAQSGRASGAEFFTAVVAGYEVGIRVGEFLGRSHYRFFHTTGTAGTFAAAAAAGRLYRLDTPAMLRAFGSAGTQAAGLWEFLRDGADSKPLHAGKAAANGLLAASLARRGFAGARNILEGPQGVAAAMSLNAEPARLADRLGSRWALAETSFKIHASCRHTHPAADALAEVIRAHRLRPDRIRLVRARVHQVAIDVLGSVGEPANPHQAKFSLGTVLGLLVCRGNAGMADFERHFRDPEVVAFRQRVRMEVDAEVEAAYPSRWIGKVEVQLTNGRTLRARIDHPKGDPRNTLTRGQIIRKACSLADHSGAATEAEVLAAADRILSLRGAPAVGRLLPAAR